MIYLLTAIGQPHGGSNTVHIYTQTTHRTTQNKQYIEQHKKFGRVRAVPLPCGFNPGICLTTEEKARKKLSQGSRRVPAGTIKIHKHTIRIHRHNNKNIISCFKLKGPITGDRPKIHPCELPLLVLLPVTQVQSTRMDYFMLNMTNK